MTRMIAQEHYWTVNINSKGGRQTDENMGETCYGQWSVGLNKSTVRYVH